MTDVRTGDIVRVVLEGEALAAGHAEGHFEIGLLGRQRNSIFSNASHVKSVEVIKRKLPAVGDVVTADEIVNLGFPVGTILGDKRNQATLIRHAKGWIWLQNSDIERYDDWKISASRTVVFIPGQ